MIGYQISKSFSITFRNCVMVGYFPAAWKIASVVPVHKKGNKQIPNNYGTISLLHICGKLFEKIIFNDIFQILTENKLFKPNRSGFMPGDFSIY